MSGKIPFALTKVWHLVFFRDGQGGLPCPSAIFIATMGIALRERKNHVKTKNTSYVHHNQERLIFM
jgi:hypothetical protein